MLKKIILSKIYQELPFTANKGQEEVLNQLAEFMLLPTERKTFILKGYAGTGKTSIVSALVRALEKMDEECVLLAPTGRAAKVMTQYAGQPAFTIHKWIYRGGKDTTNPDAPLAFSLAENPMTHTLFIVDEASMIAAENEPSVFGSGNLLDDLIRYVFTPSAASTHSANCSLPATSTIPTNSTLSATSPLGNHNALLLVGDDAQLPPVGQTYSRALDADFLRGYGLEIMQGELKEVARQALDSGILKNATRIRQTQDRNITAEKDVLFLPPNDFIEAIETAYQEVGMAETIVLVKSNIRANLYNQGIRSKILWKEDMLSNGDRLMVCRNNYFWTKEYMGISFLANGDTMEVTRLRNEREMYGFHFIDASLRLLDYDWDLDAMLWLDTLTMESGEAIYSQQRVLYERIAEDYSDIQSKRERDRLIRESPYYNALQTRYAYAVTCHKAQGGQWERVFIDSRISAKITEDPTEQSRWLYTALTRAKQMAIFPKWEKKE